MNTSIAPVCILHYSSILIVMSVSIGNNGNVPPPVSARNRDRPVAANQRAVKTCWQADVGAPLQFCSDIAATASAVKSASVSSIDWEELHSPSLCCSCSLFSLLVSSCPPQTRIPRPCTTRSLATTSSTSRRMAQFFSTSVCLCSSLHRKSITC